MTEAKEKIEFALIQEIKKSPGYVNPRKFLMNYDLDNDTIDSIVNYVAAQDNIIYSSGMFRYLTITKDLIALVTDMMDFEQKYIDLAQIYNLNIQKMNEIGIKNSQELYAALEKYMKLTPTAISTRVRSSEIIESLKKMGMDEKSTDVNESSNDFDDEEMADKENISVDEAILRCLTNEYKTVENICKESTIFYESQVDSASVVKTMAETKGVVHKIPHEYRRINVTRDDLIVLLKQTGFKIGYNQCSLAVIFTSIASDCIDKDIRSPEELGQLVEQFIPELKNNISARLDLSNRLIYDGTMERKILFKTDDKDLKERPKMIKSLNDDNYTRIRKSLIEIMKSGEAMSFSTIRNRLITEYSPQEMRDELQSMFMDGLVFKRNDNTFRLHSEFKKEDLQNILSNYSHCIIAISRIYAELFLELKKIDIKSPSELKSVITLCDNISLIDSTYNLISFDNEDPIEFIQ